MRQVGLETGRSSCWCKMRARDQVSVDLTDKFNISRQNCGYVALTPPFGLCFCLRSIAKRICFHAACPLDEGTGKLQRSWRCERLLGSCMAKVIDPLAIILSDHRISWHSPSWIGVADDCGSGMHVRTTFDHANSVLRTLYFNAFQSVIRCVWFWAIWSAGRHRTLWRVPLHRVLPAHTKAPVTSRA